MRKNSGETAGWFQDTREGARAVRARLSHHGALLCLPPIVTAGSQSDTRVHVLVITALSDERDGLTAIEGGALGDWEPHQDSAGFTYHVRELAHASGKVLRVAVACPVDMGSSSTSNVATRLVKELRPVCLAMSGICAGRRGEVSLGDVVVARVGAGTARASLRADVTGRAEAAFDAARSL